MVKTPKTRHSKRASDPVTIDLEPGAVSRIADDKASTSNDEPAVEAAQSDAVIDNDVGHGKDDAAAPVAAEDNTEAKEGSERSSFDYSFEDQPPKPASEWPSSNASGEPSPSWGKAENASVGARQPRAVRNSRSGIGAGILGGVIALAGAGALQFAGILGAPGSAALDGVNSQVASLQREITALTESQNGGGAAAKVDGLSQSLDQVRADLSALKSAVDASTPADGAELGALNDKVQQVEAAVTALGEAAKVEPVDLAPVNEKLSALEASIKSATDAATEQSGRLTSLEQSFASLSTTVEAQASQPKIALAIAASALKSALDRGAPFAAELETFAAIAPDAPQLATLRAYAEKGVPTRAEIAAETDAAANAMIAAGRPVDENAGFVERLMSSAESLVKVRPIGAVEGEGVPETVARMEVAVTQADYERALSEYESLPDAAKAAGAEFAGRLKARMEVEAQVDALISSAMKT
ncbi:MAG: COG4223 family protein [Mesorhizobium sp.]|nr:COG4223 family protein [Mesorhizobium sp.]